MTIYFATPDGTHRFELVTGTHFRVLKIWLLGDGVPDELYAYVRLTDKDIEALVSIFNQHLEATCL